MNIKQALSKIEKTKKSVGNTIAKEAAEYIQAKMIENVKKDTGELAISIQLNENKITVNSDYAIFVEFGTGIVGKKSPHLQYQQANWAYDINNHGDSGWVFPTRGGGYRRTRGQIPNSFTYDAIMSAKSKYGNKIEVIWYVNGTKSIF